MVAYQSSCHEFTILYYIIALYWCKYFKLLPLDNQTYNHLFAHHSSYVISQLPESPAELSLSALFAFFSPGKFSVLRL